MQTEALRNSEEALIKLGVAGELRLKAGRIGIEGYQMGQIVDRERVETELGDAARVGFEPMNDLVAGVQWNGAVAFEEREGDFRPVDDVSPRKAAGKEKRSDRIDEVELSAIAPGGAGARRQGKCHDSIFSRLTMSPNGLYISRSRAAQVSAAGGPKMSWRTRSQL